MCNLFWYQLSVEDIPEKELGLLRIPGNRKKMGEKVAKVTGEKSNHLLPFHTSVSATSQFKNISLLAKNE